MSAITLNLDRFTSAQLRVFLDKVGCQSHRNKSRQELIKTLTKYLSQDSHSSVLDEVRSAMHYQSANGNPVSAHMNQNGSRILPQQTLSHSTPTASNIQRIIAPDNVRSAQNVFVSSQTPLSGAPHNLTYSNLSVNAPLRITPQGQSATNGYLYQPTAGFARGAQPQNASHSSATPLGFPSSTHPRQQSSTSQVNHYPANMTPLGAVNYPAGLNGPRSLGVTVPNSSVGNAGRRIQTPMPSGTRPSGRPVMAVKPPVTRVVPGQLQRMVALPMENGTVSKLQFQQPHLQFSNCVFYDHKSRMTTTLVEPFILCTDNFTNDVKQQLTTHVIIELDDEKAGAIMKCCVREADPVEFGLQVIARFCMINPHEVNPATGLLLNPNVEDCLPPHLSISLNEQNLPLHCILPNNKPYMDGRRSPKPINLTSLLNFDSMRQPNSAHRTASIRNNLLRISWVHYLPLHQYYAVGVYFAFRNQYSDLARDLSNSRLLSEEHMKSIIQRRLGGKTSTGDDDCIAVTSDLSISLKCPLLQSRIRLPVRTKACTHLQSFCLYNYLMMNDQKVFWKCSLCKQSAKFEDLYVDNFLLSVLRNPSTTAVDHVVYRPDGSWGIPTVTDEESPRADETPNSISTHAPEKSSAVPTTPPAIQKMPAPSSTLPPPAATTSEEVVIDLISSDEEDNAITQKSVDPPSLSVPKTTLTNGVSTSEPVPGTVSSDSLVSGRLKRKVSEASHDSSGEGRLASEVDSSAPEKRPLLSALETKDALQPIPPANTQPIAKVNDLFIVISDSEDEEAEAEVEVDAEKSVQSKSSDTSRQSTAKSGPPSVPSTTTQSATHVTARSTTPSITTLSTSTSVINSTTSSTPSNNPKVGTAGNGSSSNLPSSSSSSVSGAAKKDGPSSSSSLLDSGRASGSFVTTTTTTTPFFLGPGQPTMTSSSVPGPASSRQPFFSELADRNRAQSWVGQIRRSIVAEGNTAPPTEIENKARRQRQ